jgi:hypothetical protein
MRRPFLVILVVLAAGCSPSEPPAVNAEPAHHLRVFGLATPSLTVRVGAQYFTSEKKCQRDGRPQSTWVEAPVTRTEGQYEASVSLDHFQQGECRWRPFMIGFHISTAGGLSTGSRTDGGEFAPGAEGKVWISVPGDERQGGAFVRPLDLQCSRNELLAPQAISCVPNSPRELPLLSTDATEVQVDFTDQTS